MLIFITLSLSFVGSRNDKVMLQSPVLWYDIDSIVLTEYSNFDPKHDFLSSVEAEIISFC